jgi:hypothetical protein
MSAKLFLVMLSFCACFFARETAYARIDFVIEKYPIENWQMHGARIYYDADNVVTIDNSGPMPVLTSSMLNLGKVNFAKYDYSLSLNVLKIQGEYALRIYTGEAIKDKSSYLELQGLTANTGSADYNIDESRIVHPGNDQEIAIEFLLKDPANSPGDGLLRLQALSFGSKE